MRFTFLMCSERSGSNLIARLFDAHPAVCGPATKHLFNPVVRNAFRYAPLEQAGHWAALLDDVHALVEAPFSRWRHRFERAELDALARPGDLAGLLRGLFETEARAHGKSQVFVKENQLHEFLPFVLLNFEGARVVTMVRDPRDMALSWWRDPGHPGGVCRAARQWVADQQQSLKLHHLMQAHGRSVLLHYEALIADPAQALGPALAAMGLAWDPAMLGFHEDALTRDNAGRQPAWANLDKAVMADNQRKYLSDLTAEQLLAVETLCAPEMALLGYRCESGPAERQAFAEQHLARVEREDALSKRHEPAPAVQANVEAKRRFYAHQPAGPVAAG